MAFIQFPRFLRFSYFIAFACLLPCRFLDAGTLRLLHGEVESLSLRIELIAQATSTIDIAYYEISDDDTAGQLLSALVKAVERGVAVRVIVDGHVGSNEMPKALMQYLIEHGVCIREFPVDVRYEIELGRQRLHDKLFIVDQTHLVTGGRNLEQEYFGRGARKYVDRDVYVVDACVVQQTSEYYSQRWNDCRTGQPTLVRKEKPKTAKRQEHPEWNCMERTQALELVHTWLESRNAAPLSASDLGCSTLHFESVEVDDCHLRFLHDFVGRAKDESGAIGPEVLRLIRQARRSIDIETPYFAISNELKSILVDAAQRGLQVRVLTNSLMSTDQIAVHASLVNNRRSLLRAGIELYELQGRNTLHAKSVVIDGAIATVGSYNFDMLSERRNSEVALVVHDIVFASQVSQSMSTHRAQSKKILRGELFRYEATETQASDELVKQLRRLRVVAPLIKRFL